MLIALEKSEYLKTGRSMVHIVTNKIRRIPNIGMSRSVNAAKHESFVSLPMKMETSDFCETGKRRL